MSIDTTCGDAGSLPAGEHARRRLLLVAAWHPEPACAGRWCVAAPGSVLLLGRGGDALGPGGLDDEHVSRAHAEIRIEGDAWRVRDLGSRNGTRVGGRRVDAADLPPGSVLGIGRLLLVAAEVGDAWAPPLDPEILGIGGAVADLIASIEAVAPRDTTVLLAGEPGAGKELVARRLHARSGRRGQMVAVNCAGLADGLMQSELFGHTRGAYSGATGPRRGLVLEAAGGTLFLDEIGDASPALQAAVLRLLQEREVRPVGDDRHVHADARFVAATNRDLAAEVAAGRFRADLLARLERWVMRVPPLRERREDVIGLALAFAARHAGRPVALSREFAAALLARSWPGNVRQLDAVVERAVIAAPGRDPLPLVEEALPREEAGRARSGPGGSPRSDRAGRGRRPVRPSRDDLEERLREAGGNLTALARTLGVSRPTLYRWLRDEGLDLGAARRD